MRGRFILPRMKSKQNLIGQTFNRITVLSCAGKDNNRNVIWLCKCSCGTEKIIRGSSLLLGNTLSCGCFHREKAGEHLSKIGKLNVTHGLSRTPTWVSWSMMMQRCNNPKRTEYHNYGARGIKPCAYLSESPASVSALIGDRPSNDLSIDRVDVNGGYTCGQCKECLESKWPLNIQWSNRTKQARNRRDNVKLMHEGQILTRSEWAEKLGKTYGWVRFNIG